METIENDLGTWPDDLPTGQVRQILLHPDPLLRAIAEPAGYLPGCDLARLAADMLATMYAAKGRGLAAPQIGISRRMFVMDADWKSGAARPLLLIDPEITSLSEERAVIEEGCLSIPDMPVSVDRPVSVAMRWYDLDGKIRSVVLNGALARIAQHEADHLDGRLIVDLLP